MYQIDIRFVKNELAASRTVFARGENLYLLGSCRLVESYPKKGIFTYLVTGSTTEYEVSIHLASGSGITFASCTCPYPHNGCKHVVAACLDIAQRMQEHRIFEVRREETAPVVPTPGGGKTKGRNRVLASLPDSAKALITEAPHGNLSASSSVPYLLPSEIRSQALESRIERSATERLKLIAGETYVGVHQVRHLHDEPYVITIYDPSKRLAHCTCPDYAVNNLMTCKHLIFAFNELDKQFGSKQVTTPQYEVDLPFVHITWNSAIRKPVCYMPRNIDASTKAMLQPLFDGRGEYRESSLVPLFNVYREHGDLLEASTMLKFDQRLLDKIDEVFFEEQVARLEKECSTELPRLKTDLYPYQSEGIRFAVFRRAAILADEMGLGKTIQAIATACMKKEIFGIESVLIICPASLKRQWRMEIEKFTDHKALLLEGPPASRRHMISKDKTFFKIINYEMILRDLEVIKQYPPDLVVLDEAQRIKNFSTKTHQAIKQIPRSHSLVLTGTPLENKLEDLYSIVQFCNPEVLSPLWAFAAQHYRLSRERGNKILGYHNLDLVHEKIKPLFLRRTKAEVFDSLPEVTRSRIHLDPEAKQLRRHQAYLQSLQSIVRKKVLTPMDMQRMQKLLLGMRMVCDAHCLVDEKSKDKSSPKLVELASLLRDVVLEGRRKVIIFSEWTSMTALVGSVVSGLGLDFVEFSGKVPVKKRQLLIDEFRTNPSCMVFIATDAGGVGLNLQHCDFLVNMELPWNPAKLNQRIGRIHRIGQKSNKIHVVDMVMTGTIEEKIATGLGLKQELFDAVFSGNATEVDFNREGRSQFLNQINALLEAMQSPVHSPAYESTEKPELDVTDPHYLNPQLLGEDDTDPWQATADTDTIDEAPVASKEQEHASERSDEVDLTEEYHREDLIGSSGGVGDESGAKKFQSDEPQSTQGSKSPMGTPGSETQREQLQAVLNQGMAFLNTLSQMSTGKALFSPGASKPIEIDAETGEVVMRFKLE